MQPIYLKLSDALPLIANADLLLWRQPPGRMRGFISSSGRSVYYHASMLAWWESDCMVLDTHWRAGGDIRLLAGDVKKHSGLLDWFQVNPRNEAFDREGAVRYMRRLVDTPYGFYGVLQAGYLHMPVVRRFTHPDMDDDAVCTFPPFCSDAISRADRIGGGVDPVLVTADRITEPADLPRGGFYRYRGTLQWDESAENFLRAAA